MDPLDFGRWQFGITTVYHFFMVPLTLGLGLVVTYLYICYVRTKKDEYKRMTKFWGKLYLINFAMGVATGLVQEFQFGMAWSEYSRFVGDCSWLLDFRLLHPGGKLLDAAPRRRRND